MTNIVTAELFNIVEITEYKLTALIGVGEVKWEVHLKSDAIASEHNYYCKGHDAREQLLKLLKSSLSTEVDEHSHDAQFVILRNEHKEKQRILAEEAQAKNILLRAQAEERLRKEATEVFNGLTVKIESLNKIVVSNGKVHVDIIKDTYNETQRWVVDNTYSKQDSWTHRWIKYGEKKSSVKLSKLDEFIRRILKNKTEALVARKTQIVLTKENDDEMLALGWAPNGETFYDYTVNPTVSRVSSNNGTVYKKDNVSCYVKRIDGVLYIEQYTASKTKIRAHEFRVI